MAHEAEIATRRKNPAGSQTASHYSSRKTRVPWLVGIPDQYLLFGRLMGKRIWVVEGIFDAGLRNANGRATRAPTTVFNCCPNKA